MKPFLWEKDTIRHMHSCFDTLQDEKFQLPEIATFVNTQSLQQSHFRTLSLFWITGCIESNETVHSATKGRNIKYGTTEVLGKFYGNKTRYPPQRIGSRYQIVKSPKFYK